MESTVTLVFPKKGDFYFLSMKITVTFIKITITFRGRKTRESRHFASDTEQDI